MFKLLASRRAPAILAFGLIACAHLSPAAPIYRIDFSGTIDSGTLLLTPRSRFDTISVPFTPGGSIRGSIFADLANASEFRTDSFGVHWVAPMSARIELTLPPLPDDSLGPVPSTFVVPESFGAGLQLQFATTAQVVFPRFTFSEPDPGDRNYRNDGNFSVFLGPGPGIVIPPGAIHPDFDDTNLTGTGGFRVLKVDQTVSADPPLFGLTEFYDLSVNFTAEEARGGFVPEPGTATLLGLPVLLLICLRARKTG